jgi:hypothetical protein
MDKPTRTNYIFVDFENVQDFDLDLIAGKPVKVFLIVGQQRKSLPPDLAKKLQKYHEQVRLIESEGASRNALDLVLAYHVGAQSAADPQGYFHILAKDKDYDPLIKHLKANHILASRDEAFAKIPTVMDVGQLSLTERVERTIECFLKNHTNRPTRKKTLLSHIHALFRKQLSTDEVQRILDALVVRRVVEFTPQEQVVYRL